MEPAKGVPGLKDESFIERRGRELGKRGEGENSRRGEGIDPGYILAESKEFSSFSFLSISSSSFSEGASELKLRGKERIGEGSTFIFELPSSPSVLSGVIEIGIFPRSAGGGTNV